MLLKTDRSMAACCTANGRHIGSMAAGPPGVPPSTDLPSGKDRRRSMLGQTRVQRHAVLSISMAADPHAVGAVGGQNHPPLWRRLIYILGKSKHGGMLYNNQQDTGSILSARDSEEPPSPGRSAFGVGSRATVCQTHKRFVYGRILSGAWRRPYGFLTMPASRSVFTAFLCIFAEFW